METLALIATVKILLLFALSFVITVVCTPIMTHFLYKYQLKKSVRVDMESTPIVATLHKHKEGTPTMGGIIIWGTVALLAFVFHYASLIFDAPLFENASFLSRSETWVPLGILLLSAVIGLVDDIFNIKKMGANGGGLRMWHRLFLFTFIASLATYWFYFKLDWTILHIPFYGNIDIGLWTIPLFMLVIISTAFSVNETDGLDGLAGGVVLAAFISYVGIAFFQGNYQMATFASAISGALLAFLWFNIHPARFFMGDTGSMSLGVTLGVIALLTNTIWLLPFLGFILVLESLSVLIQWTSKYLRNGKKVFKAAPIHHHFEAIGWEEPKVVMRFWIISGVMCVLGLVLYLLDASYLAL